jgi:uroporphyrinogen-III synthase
VSAPPTDGDRRLDGRVVAVVETRQIDVLAGLLERRGAKVLRCPLIGIDDAPDERAVAAWIARLATEPADLVVFYTGEGVERLLACARRAGLEAEFMAALTRTPKLVRGPKPKRALRSLGLDAEHAAAEPTTAGLLAAAQAIATPRGRVAIQLYSEDQDRRLIEHFERRGAAVDCVAPYVYAPAETDERVAALLAELAAGRVDAIAFTSSAQVARLLAVARERGLTEALRSGLARTKVAAVGPVVAAELADAGIRVDAVPAASYSMKPLVASIGELLARS